MDTQASNFPQRNYRNPFQKLYISAKNMGTTTATLSNSGCFTSFAFRDQNIRFRTSDKLIKYMSVKEWDHGYLVVTARYATLGEVEDYIDLIPILKNLYIDIDTFLKPIKRVEIV